MLSLTGFITVATGREAEFEALARRLWAETHAREPGVHRYEYMLREQPGTYVVSMLFDDHDAFIAHQASDHHLDLAGQMRNLIVGLQLEYGVPLDGAFGRPDARAGDPVIDEPDDEPSDDVRARYAARYPAPDVAWWP
jgi:quinol monooxygenase YgiN